MSRFRTANAILMAGALLLAIGCSSQRNSTASYKDNVKKALEQADLVDVTVDENQDRNTITLGGKVRSEEAKNRAGDVAKAAAGTRVIANQVSIQPVGVEGEAKDIASNIDDGIENNFKAVLISTRLDKQDIRYNSKNGVLTLQGSVVTAQQRQEAQDAAAKVPNVAQVVNEIQLKHK